MNADDLLSQITIPTPCLEDWSSMSGDDRVRRCAACGKHVYNLTTTSSSQVLALIDTHGGDLCGRVYLRSDGTIVTSNCQPPVVPTEHPRQFHIRGIMAVIAGIAAALGVGKSLAEKPIPPTAAPPPLLAEDRAQPTPSPLITNHHMVMGMLVSPRLMNSAGSGPVGGSIAK